MMRGPHKVATAVRKPDGEIVTDITPLGKIRTGRFVKLPIIRGCVNFIDSMVIGVKSLMYSAQFFDVDDDGNPVEQEPSKFEKWLESKLDSEKAMNAVIYFSVFVSLILSVGLFILLPALITGFLKGVVKSAPVLTLAEGVVRIIIFISYLFLVSLTKDIKRVFMYHGAEHKCINCIEHGMELNVENVLKSSREHKRCGTSFLFFVVIVSVIFFLFIHVDSPLWRVVIRLLLIPVIAGVSFEIIRLAGNSENPVIGLLSKPGLLLQRLTTAEPDAAMVEVAIAAVEAVFDWREYLAENGMKVEEK